MLDILTNISSLSVYLLYLSLAIFSNPFFCNSSINDSLSLFDKLSANCKVYSVDVSGPYKWISYTMTSYSFGASIPMMLENCSGLKY